MLISGTCTMALAIRHAKSVMLSVSNRSFVIGRANVSFRAIVLDLGHIASCCQKDLGGWPMGLVGW
jgi:hypothetical protein